MPYRINLQLPHVTLQTCTFAPSREAGKTLCIQPDGSALCIEPSGAERFGGVPAGDPNFDSPYTQGTIHGDLLVYQSAFAEGPGIPVAYRMVTA